jgi:hypothetical protein
MFETILNLIILTSGIALLASVVILLVAANSHAIAKEEEECKNQKSS